MLCSFIRNRGVSTDNNHIVTTLSCCQCAVPIGSQTVGSSIAGRAIGLDGCAGAAAAAVLAALESTTLVLAHAAPYAGILTGCTPFLRWQSVRERGRSYRPGRTAQGLRRGKQPCGASPCTFSFSIFKTNGLVAWLSRTTQMLCGRGSQWNAVRRMSSGSLVALSMDLMPRLNRVRSNVGHLCYRQIMTRVLPLG